jgi:hypothetical protein
MRSGKLLALDTPQALKEQLVPGDVFEVYAQPLLGGLEAFAHAPQVLCAVLAGDHLRVITARGTDQSILAQVLSQSGVEISAI